MKKFLTYFAMAFALLACSKTQDVEMPESESNIKIGVFVAGKETTKVDVHQINDGSPGEGAYGEN